MVWEKVQVEIAGWNGGRIRASTLYLQDQLHMYVRRVGRVL